MTQAMTPAITSVTTDATEGHTAEKSEATSAPKN
jgi:hypothetical protein